MQDSIYNIVGRNKKLFIGDWLSLKQNIEEEIQTSSFLVIGAGGTIGQATVKEIAKCSPLKLHAIDISENNLVELVRDLRSSIGDTGGEFKALPLDVGSKWFEKYAAVNGPFDYVLNLSAMKHVRSEGDVHTILRMIETNIFNSLTLQTWAENWQSKKYFCVSTDKAANPVNMMGASKRIMEIFLEENVKRCPISMARFANVAFSDGSLLCGFSKRLEKKQPISAPSDTKRYFITPEESGKLCLFSALFGKNNEIFVPKATGELELTDFATIAVNFLRDKQLEPVIAQTEFEARDLIKKLNLKIHWPVYFFESDTTGEKPFEEFYTENESVGSSRYEEISVVIPEKVNNSFFFSDFKKEFYECFETDLRKETLVNIFRKVVPNFNHRELGRSLNDRM